jgi:hypothetical protein
MEEAFGDPEKRSRALGDLGNLKQDKQSFADFITAFNSKILKTGAYLEFKKTKKKRLQSAINSRLFRAIIRRDIALTYNKYRC